jgi:hypothetical protein
MRISVAMILMAGLACGSRGNAAEFSQRECQDLEKTLFRQPKAIQRELFANNGIEQRYVIYLCANQYTHPPRLEVADFLADGGAVAAVFLREKLQLTTDDLTVRDITRAFQIMKSRGTFDARRDFGLMHLLEEKIAVMKRPGWKAVVEDMYREIARAP